MRLPHATTPPPAGVNDVSNKDHADAQLPDYLYARLSSTQTTNLSQNNHVEFDWQYSHGTSIALSSGTGQENGIFTLEGGKTYEIRMFLGGAWNEQASSFRWHDDDTEAVIYNDSGTPAFLPYLYDSNNATDSTKMSSGVFIYSPTSTVNITLDQVSTTVPVNLENGKCVVFIKEF